MTLCQRLSAVGQRGSKYFSSNFGSQLHTKKEEKEAKFLFLTPMDFKFVPYCLYLYVFFYFFCFF